MTNKELNTLLETLMQLSRKTVGVSFLLEAGQFEAFDAPTTTNQSSYCGFVRRVTRGESYKLTIKNLACLGGAISLGFVKPSPLITSGYTRFKSGSYKDLCVSRSISKSMVYCEHDLYGVGLKPLEQYDKDPDVVILVTSPYNAMRIIQGHAFHNGSNPGFRMNGMQAICQECTSYPFETNQLNVSMLCPGTRMLAQWTKDELAIGIPFNKLELIVDGIKATMNPFERNKDKAIIEEKAKINGLADSVKVVYDQNYDDHSYSSVVDRLGIKDD